MRWIKDKSCGEDRIETSSSSSSSVSDAILLKREEGGDLNEGEESVNL